MEVKSGSRRKFWEGATKKKQLLLFFLKKIFKLGQFHFKVVQIRGERHFLGGRWGAHFEIHLAENFDQKNRACRQFEVFSNPVSVCQCQLDSYVRGLDFMLSWE